MTEKQKLVNLKFDLIKLILNKKMNLEDSKKIKEYLTQVNMLLSNNCPNDTTINIENYINSMKKGR